MDGPLAKSRFFFKMTDQPKPTRVSGIKVAIAVIPALLILSICIALYLGANADQEEAEPLKGEVSIAEMADYLRKLNVLIGPRVISTKSGQQEFRKINAMTIGTLGPENLGYEVLRRQSDAAFGLLWTTTWIEAGDRESDEPVVVAIPLAESGTCVAFGYGLAEYLTSHQATVAVRIVFYPPLVGPDLKSWIWERVGKKGETLAGFISLGAGRSGVGHAALRVPREDLSAIQEVTLRNRLDDQVVVSESQESSIEVSLIENEDESREVLAQRLLRILPLVKDLIESFKK